MLLVWVLTVLNPTTSSLAIPGPSRSDSEKPKDIKLAFAERLNQALAIDRTAAAASECVEQTSRVLRT